MGGTVSKPSGCWVILEFAEGNCGEKGGALLFPIVPVGLKEKRYKGELPIGRMAKPALAFPDGGARAFNRSPGWYCGQSGYSAEGEQRAGLVARILEPVTLDRGVVAVEVSTHLYCPMESLGGAGVEWKLSLKPAPWLGSSLEHWGVLGYSAWIQSEQQ